MRLRRLVPLSGTQARRGLTATAALLAALIGLSACGTENAGSEPTSDATTPAPTGSATADEDCEPGDALPAIAGDYGDVPAFTWPSGCAPEGLQVDVLSEGSGTEVAPSAAVLANYAGYVWGSEVEFDSSFSRGAASLFSLNSVVDGWATGIPGATVGSRLLISIPPDLGYGPTGNEGAGIGGEDTIVFVVDVVDTFNPDQAGQGDATVVDTPDLPVVIEGALGEPATLTVSAESAEPTEAAVYRVADGSGAPLAIGQSVAIAYTVTYWDGSSTETSWLTADDEGVLSASTGPMVAYIGSGTIFDLLEGVPVGSRAVLVAPGSNGSPALAVVADVLGAA